MPVTPARAAAFEILLRVERDNSYASELLHSDRNAKLSPADHGLATELVMGVLRLGMYQLMFLSRVPARAAIFETVELAKTARKRSAAPFVNAVLRKASANQPDLVTGMQDAIDEKTLVANSAHPDWLVARWTERYGLAAARQICTHDQTVPATAIHVQDDLTADQDASVS